MELLEKRVKPYHRKGYPTLQLTSIPLDSPDTGRNSEDDEDALVTHQQLTCDPGLSKLCVAPLKWNSSQHSWEEVQHHLPGAYSSNLKGQINQLQLELRQQLQDTKQLIEQEVFQTQHDNLPLAKYKDLV